VFEDVSILSKQEHIEEAEKTMNNKLLQDDDGDGWLIGLNAGHDGGGL